MSPKLPPSSKKKNPRGKVTDLNCDLGEGVGNDKALFPFISSANIACGYHAGDEKTIWQTIRLAQKYKVAIGAHPSYLDKENFGRVEMNIPADDTYELVTQQLLLFHELAQAAGATIHHVKPHGALYNQSARNKKIAKAIARAIRDFDDRLILFGLSGSHSITEATALGLRTANEVFADRRYRDNGSLVPRSNSRALIIDREEAIKQVLQMILKKTVTTITGKKVRIRADTICIHGDHSHAIDLSKRIYQSLKKNKIAIKAI